MELCDFYEGYDKNGTDAVIANGIYSLDDLKSKDFTSTQFVRSVPRIKVAHVVSVLWDTEFGEERGWCPYFLARHVINHANILIYNYQYVLDPKVRHSSISGTSRPSI